MVLSMTGGAFPIQVFLGVMSAPIAVLARLSIHERAKSDVPPVLRK
jgi:hypothetical protein